MEEIKNIALVAHDNRKKDLIEWIEWNYTSLIEHKLICTGTTGKMVEQVLKKKLEKEDIDLHIDNLKAALVNAGAKEAVFAPERLTQNNRAGRKMMQSYFKKRGVKVVFAS